MKLAFLCLDLSFIDQMPEKRRKFKELCNTQTNGQQRQHEQSKAFTGALEIKGELIVTILEILNK